MNSIACNAKVPTHHLASCQNQTLTAGGGGEAPGGGGLTCQEQLDEARIMQDFIGSAHNSVPEEEC